MQEPISKFIRVNGIQLHYLDWGGEGPTCIMLHGSGTCAGSWEPIAHRISRRFHCIAPDLRDHGDSEKTSGYVDWSVITADFVEFYDALDLHDAVLVAHSRGASAGMLSASQRPERFAGAYLIEPSILLNLHRALDGQGREQRPPSPEPPKRLVFQSRQALFDRYRARGGFTQTTDESLWAFINYGTHVLPDGTVELKCTDPRSYGTPRKPEEIWAQLARVSFPVQLIYGAESHKQADSPEIKEFCSVVPTDFKVVPGTHNTAMEFPDLHSEMILKLADDLARTGRLPKRPIS